MTTETYSPETVSTREASVYVPLPTPPFPEGWRVFLSIAVLTKRAAEDREETIVGVRGISWARFLGPGQSDA